MLAYAPMQMQTHMAMTCYTTKLCNLFCHILSLEHIQAWLGHDSFPQNLLRCCVAHCSISLDRTSCINPLNSMPTVGPIYSTFAKAKVVFTFFLQCGSIILFCNASLKFPKPDLNAIWSWGQSHRVNRNRQTRSLFIKCGLFKEHLFPDYKRLILKHISNV